MKKGTIVFAVVLIVAVALFGIYAMNIINSRDGNAPEITVKQETVTVSVSDSEEKWLEGVTAYDIEDGDVTESLLVESVSDFDGNGERTVTVAAFDSENRVSKAEFKIKYSDYTSPVFSCKEQINVTTWDDATIIGGITATDCIDGDISSDIVIDDYELIDSYSGLYYVTFSVENSAGDVAKTNVAVLYAVVSKNLPVITLTERIVYINAGDVFNPGKYVESVKYPVGSGSGEYSTDWTETDEPGSYIVTYVAESDNGYIGYAYITVNVREE